METALGRALTDDEIFNHVEDEDEEGEEAGGQGSQEEEKEGGAEEEVLEEAKPSAFEHWIADKCSSMRFIPARGEATGEILLALGREVP